VFRSYTHLVAPEAGDPPTDGSANNHGTSPQTKRDFGWWLTTIGTVFVPVLALVLAIISLAYQNQATQQANRTAQQANQIAQSALKTAQSALTLANRTDAASVSFSGVPHAPTQFTIDNRENNPINAVYIQPAASRGSLDPLGSITGCRGFTITLPGAAAPVMYFKDANGQSWEEQVNGVAEPAADLASFFELIPSSAISSKPPAEGPPQLLSGC
jgi:hypothetical protein